MAVLATSADASLPYSTMKASKLLKTEHLRHKVKCNDSTINIVNDNKVMRLSRMPLSAKVVNKTPLSFSKMGNCLYYKSTKMIVALILKGHKHFFFLLHAVCMYLHPHKLSNAVLG